MQRQQQEELRRQKIEMQFQQQVQQQQQQQQQGLTWKERYSSCIMDFISGLLIRLGQISK